MSDKRTIEANRERLIDTVKTNRNAHLAVFYDAVKDWEDDLKKAVAELAESPLNAEKLAKASRINLFKPKNFSREYERAIAQLEMDVRETIVLSLSEANQLISDEWDFVRDIDGNQYMSKAKGLM